MRAWSARLEGLQLAVPPGWYELAPHLAGPEVRRLAELLARGMPDLEQVIELDVGVLDELAPKLSFLNAVLVVNVPADAPAGRLESLQSRLGAVRLGLVQRGQPTSWPDVAWQERFVKGPLLSVLKRELRSETHPFAALGIGTFPLDEIAKLTPEPIELLEIVEDAIDHRITHATVGTEAEDWLRSALHAAADRVAGRLSSMPSELLRRAIDVIIDTPEGSRSTIDDREASLALTHAGLAWSEGADLLLSPLACFGLSTRGIGRLVQRFPEDAWSDAGKTAIHAAIPAYLPPLRVNLIAPEPPYATWPVVVPIEVLDGIRPEVLGRFDDESQRELATIEFEVLSTRVREIESGPPDTSEPRARLLALRTIVLPREGWLELLEACNTALDELDDEPLVALDFERGGIRRFDRIDRLSGGLGADAEKLAALVRWRGITAWLGRVTRVSEIEMLTAQAEFGLAGARADVRLRVALQALVGDLWALQQRYRSALEWWEIANHETLGEDAQGRLFFRRLFGLMRLDDPAILEQLQLDSDRIVAWGRRSAICASIMVLLTAWHSLWSPSEFDLRQFIGRGRRDEIIEITAAIEHHDWPAAARLVRDLEPGDSSRGQLVRAWFRVNLNDVDEAALVFTDVALTTEGTYDALARALAQRGLAFVALRRSRLDEVLVRLEDALEIERSIEITDSLFLDLEVALWKFHTRRLRDFIQFDMDAVLKKCVSSTGPFCTHLLVDWFMRMMLLGRIPMHEAPIDSLLQSDIPFNPSLSLELVHAILAHESTSPEKHPHLLDLARKLAGTDAALLHQIEQLASAVP